MRNPDLGRRPSSWWFALVVVPVMLGALLTYRSIATLLERVDGMVRVSVPGTREVELPAGDLIAYAEGDVGAMRCGLADATTGEAIALRRARGRTTFNIGDHHGESVFELTSPRAGRYQLSCESDVRRYTTLAFGPSLTGAVVKIVLLVLGTLAAIPATVLGVWWRRRRPRPAASVV